MAARLGLGTVQWGTPYGVANRSGITVEQEVKRILATARTHGVDLLDTAVAYGQAETVLGRQNLDYFRVVTKTPVFKCDAVTENTAQTLTEAMLRSIRVLAIPRLYGLLVHHADDLLAPGGERLIAAMQSLKIEGLVDKIGVSIYNDSQLERILKLFIPDIVQLPLNVFDQRLIINGRLAQLKTLNVEVHVRSVFLQGLLLMELASIPSYFSPIIPLLRMWHERVREHGMLPVQAALSFIRDLPEVSVIIVGVTSVEEFLQSIEQFSLPGSFDASDLQCNETAFINPSEWKFQ